MPIVLASLDVERTNFGLMSHTSKSHNGLFFEKKKNKRDTLKTLKSYIKTCEVIL